MGLLGFVPVNLNLVTVLLHAKSQVKSAFGLGSTVIVFLMVSLGLQLSVVIKVKVEVKAEVKDKDEVVLICLPFSNHKNLYAFESPPTA